MNTQSVLEGEPSLAAELNSFIDYSKPCVFAARLWVGRRFSPEYGDLQRLCFIRTLSGGNFGLEEAGRRLMRLRLLGAEIGYRIEIVSLFQAADPSAFDRLPDALSRATRGFASEPLTLIEASLPVIGGGKGVQVHFEVRTPPDGPSAISLLRDALSRGSHVNEPSLGSLIEAVSEYSHHDWNDELDGDEEDLLDAVLELRERNFKLGVTARIGVFEVTIPYPEATYISKVSLPLDADAEIKRWGLLKAILRSAVIDRSRHPAVRFLYETRNPALAPLKGGGLP